MFLALLPQLLFGVHLAVGGDALLLCLSLLSLGIYLVPRLIQQRSKEASNLVSEQDPGVFSDNNQLFLLPSAAITSDIFLVGPPALSVRFLRQLFAHSVEEIWCLGNFDLAVYREIHLGGSTERSGLAELAERSRLSLPFTLVAHLDDWNRVQTYFPARSFRTILLCNQATNSSSKLALSFIDGEIRAVGTIGADAVSLVVREQLPASEPANDAREDGVLAAGTLNLVSHASGKHGTTRSNKAKWFNFPLGRAMVSKAELGFRAGPTKNQVSESLPSQVRGANAIADISTRLRQLGHGI